MPFIDHKPFQIWEVCSSREHNPPNMIVLPEGIHTYQCPACGHKTTFIVSNPRCVV